MKLETKDKEIELIRQYREKPSEDIALYFFNKYKDLVLNIVYNKINMKFSSIPLERDDFFYTVWKSTLELLKDYDLESGLSIKNILIKKAYLNSIKDAAKFLKNTHIVLNTSYSYDKLSNTYVNQKLGDDGKNGVSGEYAQATKNFIDSVIEFNKEFPIDYLKRIIYLKSLGYSVTEISQILKRPKRNIRRAMDFVCKIAKKLYD